EAERRSPGAANGRANAVVDQPGECDLRIIGRTLERAAVGVVAEGSFQIEFPHQRNVEVISEDRDIELRKSGPDIVGLGIVEFGKRRTRGQCLGVGGETDNIIGFVSTTNGSLYLPAGKVK